MSLAEPKSSLPATLFGLISIAWIIGCIVWCFFDSGPWRLASGFQADLLGGRFYPVLSFFFCAAVALVPPLILGDLLNRLSPAYFGPPPAKPEVSFQSLGSLGVNITIQHGETIQLEKKGQVFKVSSELFGRDPIFDDTGVTWVSNQQALQMLASIDPDETIFKPLPNQRVRAAIDIDSWRAIQDTRQPAYS